MLLNNCSSPKITVVDEQGFVTIQRWGFPEFERLKAERIVGEKWKIYFAEGGCVLPNFSKADLKKEAQYNEAVALYLEEKHGKDWGVRFQKEVDSVINQIKMLNSHLSFQETQDSLRGLLLKSKPNKNIKASLLQELYIKGLVNQVGDAIVVKVPFNLHSFDCGAPDCYSTDVTFKIPATNPIVFPKEINFNIKEYGCGIKQIMILKTPFKLIAQSPNHVNYYSEKIKSNFVILGEKRTVYYFEDVQPNEIKIDLIHKIIEGQDDDDPNAIIPYRSFIMESKSYSDFIY